VLRRKHVVNVLGLNEGLGGGRDKGKKNRSEAKAKTLITLRSAKTS